MPRPRKIPIVNVKSNGTLERMSMDELKALYFSITQKEGAWGSKAELVDACIISLAETKKRKLGRPRRRLRKPAREPVNRNPIMRDPTRMEPKQPGAKFKRGQIFAMLRTPTGATFAEIQRAMEMTYSQALTHVRAINEYCGYGLVESNKRIRAFTYDEGPPCS